MSRIFGALVVAPLAAVVLSSPVLAESAINTACKAYAAAVADDYMSDKLVRLDGTETPQEGHLIVHSYGRKYVMPNHVPGTGAVVRSSIGTTTREWGKIYSEERRRCLRDRHLGEFLANN
ncbi:MAG: hypothetical protein GYA66_13855 [Phyllobacteriaceae bacterium]|jgi:hypothetical protein|nr:hypothetical protein [Phyllobacteriaceae bacterium]